MEDDPVLVRSTVHIAGGIYPGMYFWADRSRDYIREAIENELLVVEPLDEAVPLMDDAAELPDAA